MRLDSLSDIGYNIQEWNVGSLLLMLAGWTSLLYRIHAEERVLSQGFLHRPLTSPPFHTV